MKRTVYYLLVLAAFLTSCGNQGANRQAADEPGLPLTADSITLAWNGYKTVKPTDLSGNAIDMISNQWMVVTAGTLDDFNSMTASWGAMGYVWSRPSAFITIRNTRYTYQFLRDNDEFTLCFFDERYRPAMTILGTKSGRDTDKVGESGLTPVALPSGAVAYSEAHTIIECKKIYEDQLNPRSIFEDDIASDYIKSTGERHQLFIGEIVNIFNK